MGPLASGRLVNLDKIVPGNSINLEELSVDVAMKFVVINKSNVKKTAEEEEGSN